MQRPLGAQISHMLKDRGVEVIFGIPGVHNQELYRGIEEAGIKHVLARHEQGAGFMADGYARATDQPGICYLISGPGLTNAMTALGQAYSDSVPVLAIASCLDEVAATKGQLHQMLDQAGAARTVCDWSETAMDAASAYGLIDRALSEFQTSRPRAKAVHVPIAKLEGRSDPAPAGATPMTSDAARIDPTVLELSQTAARPLIIAGGGARHADVLMLAKRLGGAAFSSYAGRGLFADYDLDFGGYLGRPSSADVIASADLLLVLGSELAEVDLWRRDLGHDAPMIRVDCDPVVLNDHHRASHPVRADASAFVKALLAKLPDADAEAGWTPKEVQEARAKWRAEVEAERPGIVAICDALRAALPEDAMIYSDMTQFAYVAKEVWDMPRPGHWHHPTGFGTLGYALPAAIGGAVARKGLPTLAIAGDYGFQYTGQELGAAVELCLPLPIIVWDNGKLKEIEESMQGAQIPPNAVIARNPDFCALARAYGADACAPQSLSDMQAAVKSALSADGPTVIHLTPEILAG
ncbi:thiamine pyrophosphate-binding protein [Shimia ponticola]|uniref:thiamine pyrophosphate-binding protein n=1 Tax=Shimia ponticola TaxID=2582893 RepID=UPI0011BD60F3|nr:thiamine pyrophosphate-binding protein [Shimia ponticola]